MTAVGEAMANAAPPAPMSMPAAEPMREADVPGADRPGIAAFASVNALVERKAAIQALLGEMNGRIVELRRDAETSIRVLEDEKAALQDEAAQLPDKADEYLSRVEARVAVQRAIFGLDT